MVQAPGLFTGIISAAGMYDMLRLEENGCMLLASLHSSAFSPGRKCLWESYLMKSGPDCIKYIQAGFLAHLGRTAAAS